MITTAEKIFTTERTERTEKKFPSGSVASVASVASVVNASVIDLRQRMTGDAPVLINRMRRTVCVSG